MPPEPAPYPPPLDFTHPSASPVEREELPEEYSEVGDNDDLENDDEEDEDDDEGFWTGSRVFRLALLLILVIVFFFALTK